MASLEKSRNSLQIRVGVEPLFMLRCDRSPVILTCSRKLTGPRQEDAVWGLGVQLCRLGCQWESYNFRRAHPCQAKNVSLYSSHHSASF
jgi:hypothetical protein